MDAIVIVEAGPERLDDIRPLWEELNRHHQATSPHFSDAFKRFTFEQRAKDLQTKAEQGTLRLFFAEFAGEIVGQCVVSLEPEGLGEIDSIVVAEKHRNKKIGDLLMQAALDWLDTNGATSKTIVVVYGNESAFSFYARYGFYPRSTRLGQP